MLIKSDNKYIPMLVDLWHKVFGDSEEYIRVFFEKTYYDSECFAEIIDGNIVSAFYLMKCEIKLGGKTYNGRYLYAAATLSDHRGGGIMSKLIREALAYAEKENLDFVALVPADDGLYDYYGRFGFYEAMYKYKLRCVLAESLKADCPVIDNAEDFGKMRNTASCDMLVYNKIGSEYAFECLGFADTKIYRLSDDAYYIDGEELFIGRDCEYPAEILKRCACDEGYIYSNFSFEGAVRVRNGMIYNFRKDIELKDIYMNIALD